jgi:hypothetical protein
MRGAIPPLLNAPSWRGAQLKHRDKLTFSPLIFNVGDATSLTYLFYGAGYPLKC